MLKGQKGITLVALVITIIVLLILAGILNRAQEAGKNYTNAARYEDQQLTDLDQQTEQILRNVQGNN